MVITSKLYYTISVAAFLADPAADILQKVRRINIYITSIQDISADLLSRLSAFQHEFILTLDDEIFEDPQFAESTLDRLFVLLSLYNYSKSQDVILVCCANDFAHEEKPGIKILREHLLTHGDITMRILKYQTFLNSIHDFGDLVVDQMERTGSETQHFLNYQQNGMTTTVLHPADKTPYKLSLADYTLTAYQEYDMENYIGRGTAASESDLWRKRASLYQEFLAISKQVQEKEYFGVIEWYHNEYEVLPLWFKRLGHIIKVITGKRKLSSLVNNKLKRTNR